MTNLAAEAWKASIEARVATLAEQVTRAHAADMRYNLARINAIEARLSGTAPLDDDADLARLAGEAATYLQLTQIDAALLRIDSYLERKQIILEQLLRNQEYFIAQQRENHEQAMTQQQHNQTQIVAVGQRNHNFIVAALVLLIIGVILGFAILGGEFAIISRSGSVWFGGK